MKSIIQVRGAYPLAVLLLVLLMVGCAGSREAADEERRGAAKEHNTVTSEDIEGQPSVDLQRLLAGRVAGVRVYDTGNGIAVRIRGMTSIHGSNEPLYVVDGIPVGPLPGGALVGLSPHDVESIRVLKDPSETSMYGIRGANGVIIVTTKAN